MQPKTRFIHKIKSDGAGKDKDLSIIILASKPGPRMKSFGPQCLIKDKYGVSILQHQTEILQVEFPKSEIILVGGFEIDKIVKNLPKDVRLVENQLYEQSNDIADIRLGLNNALSENILILFGDLYFSPDVVANITKKSTLVVDDNSNLMDDDIGTTVVDEFVTILSLSIKTPKWSKIAFFSEKESKLLRQFVSNRDSGNLFMWECLNFILDKKGEFLAKQVKKNDILVHVESSKEVERIIQ